MCVHNLAYPAVAALAGMRVTLVGHLHAQLDSWQVAPIHGSLFGSTARGDGDTRSDIDLFLVRPADIPEEDPRMLALSQTQILGQVMDEAGLDSRTVGLLAFNGALLGGTLAAKNLLGHYWWTPFVGVGLSTIPCLWSVFKATSAFGPPALQFYREFGAEGLSARTQLLSDLDDTFDFNAGRVKWKAWRLRGAISMLVVGLIGAALLIAVVRPTTMKACAHAQIRVQVPGRHQSLCLPRQDFRLLVPAA